jgi:NADH:ubiquinone oxidoreductase subunit 3 (subunit A)
MQFTDHYLLNTKTKMTQILLTPPIAFLAYLLLVAVLSGIGRVLAGKERPNPLKSSMYMGGERPSTTGGVPGYRPFFVIALFFSVLHLGVLMLGSSGLTPLAGIYLLGLFLVLIALILG